jgi:hypothetical protein
MAVGVLHILENELVRSPASLIGGINKTRQYRDVSEIGFLVGGFAALGAVAGVVLAAIFKSVLPNWQISYGEWTAYSGALFGLFAALVEVFARCGVG